MKGVRVPDVSRSNLDPAFKGGVQECGNYKDVVYESYDENDDEKNNMGLAFIIFFSFL